MIIQNTECKKCKELVLSRKQTTWGFGNNKSVIMFIGECPGKNGCDITGIPFTKDKSGIYFQDCLVNIDLLATDIYVSNVVKCCPENNRTPNDEEINKCKQYLDYEINNINPKIIIPMGKTAIDYIFGKQKTMSQLVGKIYNINGRIIFPIYHPAWVLRFGEQKEYNKLFEKIKNIYEENK